VTDVNKVVTDTSDSITNKVNDFGNVDFSKLNDVITSLQDATAGLADTINKLSK
jgi:ABC-type transporter Mla subunit MlaD